MFLEILNTLLLCFFELFEGLEELNSDRYPENYVEIDGVMVEYGN